MYNKYNLVRKAIYEKHPLKLEQTAILASCKLSIQQRDFVPELKYKNQENWLEHIHMLEDGDRVFIRGYTNEGDTYLDYFLSLIEIKNIKVDFVIFVEPVLPLSVLNKLLKHSRDIFLTNNIYDIPNVHNMTLGILTHTLSTVYKYSLVSLEKKYLCILGFSYTSGERRRCYETLKNKSFITNLNKLVKEVSEPKKLCYFCDESQHPINIPCPEKKKIAGNLDIFIEPSESFGVLNTLNVDLAVLSKYRKESYFTLHPRGAGEECHSFYESLLLDSIPIVKRTNTHYDKMYTVFPCIVVNDWIDVSEKLLLENKEVYQEKLRRFKEENPNFFTDIECTYSFLRKNL